MSDLQHCRQTTTLIYQTKQPTPLGFLRMSPKSVSVRPSVEIIVCTIVSKNNFRETLPLGFKMDEFGCSILFTGSQNNKPIGLCAGLCSVARSWSEGQTGHQSAEKDVARYHLLKRASRISADSMLIHSSSLALSRIVNLQEERITLHTSL